MKVKHAILLLIVGYCLDVLGAWSIILHSSYGYTLVGIATILKLSGGLLLLFKTSTYPKLKAFGSVSVLKQFEPR